MSMVHYRDVAKYHASSFAQVYTEAIMSIVGAAVSSLNKENAAYSLSELMRKLGIAKLVVVTNQINYQFVYWGQDIPLVKKKPMIPLMTTGMTDAYGVMVPIDCTGYDVVSGVLTYDI